MLGEKGGTKVMEDWLASSLQRSLSNPGIEAMIGGPAAEVINHCSITVGLGPATDAAELARANAELSGSFGWGKKPIVHLSQHSQTIALSKAQCQHLLPRPNRVGSKVARRRTFLFQPKRTFLFQCYTST